jgi:hypothetical protein
MVAASLAVSQQEVRDLQAEHMAMESIRPAEGIEYVHAMQPACFALPAAL